MLSSVGRTAAWVRNVRSKYGRVAAWRMPTAMLLRQNPRLAPRRSIALIHQPVQVFFSPLFHQNTASVIHVSVTGRELVRHTNHTAALVMRTSPVVRERGTLATMLAAASHIQTFTRNLRRQVSSSRELRNIVERAQRFEAFACTLRTEAVFARKSAVPRERVLQEIARKEVQYLPPVEAIAQKKSAAMMPSAVREDSSVTRSTPGWDASGPAFSQNTQPAFPDMDTVADYVMKHLDRRMVAWRERMGRT